MARVKISEYRAKKILFGDAYAGVQSGGTLPQKGEWVLKVDQGVKKRMKQGLVAINPSKEEAKKRIAEWKKRGFTQFLCEPLVPHQESQEQYFSLERVREGVRMLHAKEGGINIEEHPEAVASYMIRDHSDIATVAQKSHLPGAFLLRTVEAFERSFFAFLEINPLVVLDSYAHALDAAVLVDDAAAFFNPGWSAEDIVREKAKHESESRVLALASTTPASLKLTVINPDGALFFLLSGGGGSIVIADEAELEGVGHLIANYGEYSGGPTREETYLYAKEILQLLLESKSKKKALVIAGGVANFTDVRQTFLGIIDALKEKSSNLKKHHVKVFVRRGGPNEAAGLALMREFLEGEGFFGSIAGSESVITTAVDEAIQYVLVPAPLERSRHLADKS